MTETDVYNEVERAYAGMNHMINKPKHYTQGKIECIEAIEAATSGLSGIDAVYVGNIIKYVFRYKHKNGVEDLRKAKWYLDKLIINTDVEVRY
jgi:predicted Ser/Thr protein kinase